MNQFFTTVASSLASKIKHRDLDLTLEKDTNKKWEFKKTNFNEMIKIIENLNKTKPQDMMP